MRVRLALPFATALVAVASAAWAQPQERLFISVNGAFQTTRNPFDDRIEFDVSLEKGSTATHYPSSDGAVIDGSVAIRVFKRLALGVAVSEFAHDEPVTVNSRVPHPFVFDMPREISGDVGVTRRERGIHVQAIYRFGIVKSLRVALFAGPSILRLEQDIVSSIRYDESYPYDTAVFRGADTTRLTGSATGVNAGADVAWLFTRRLGIGVLARFARAKIDLDLPPPRARKIDAGGFTAGAGVRAAF